MDWLFHRLEMGLVLHQASSDNCSYGNGNRSCILIDAVLIMNIVEKGKADDGDIPNTRIYLLKSGTRWTDFDALGFFLL